MRVLIAGSTTWEDRTAIHRELSQLAADTVVVHGDSPGADELGGSVGNELGLQVESFAKNAEDYERYGRGAWKSLNERMLASDIDLVLAFHPAIEKSKGTKHLAKLAEQMNVPVKVIKDI